MSATSITVGTVEVASDRIFIALITMWFVPVTDSAAILSALTFAKSASIVIFKSELLKSTLLILI